MLLSVLAKDAANGKNVTRREKKSAGDAMKDAQFRTQSARHKPQGYF